MFEPARAWKLALGVMLSLATAFAVTPLTRGEVVTDAKIDEAIEPQGGLQPVFVRMDDQLIRGAGDFEAFGRAHDGDRRSDLRKYVIETLRTRADRSWEALKAKVAELTKAGQIKDVTRFWVVNGFACEATGQACQALANEAGVGFVYKQTGPAQVRQHRSPATPADAEQHRILETLIREAKDDSNEPFSAKGLEIPWNLKLVQADQVWEKEGVTGKGVVVAVNDVGIVNIPALRPALWRNPAEQLNGKDDDGDGYVDDLFGYDFARHSNFIFDRGAINHGTFCAGIIAGRPLPEKPLVTGVAPRARLMILTGMGYLKAYEYALLHGADVLSMSYMWVNMELGHYRGVFRLAAEHLTAGGVLCVGGAGNFAQSAPAGKQITLPKDIPCVVAVSGVLEDGKRPQFSSKGPASWSGVRFYDDYPADKPLQKPDLTGPCGGLAVWSGSATTPNPNWKVIWDGKDAGGALVTGPQGNSFAGPHAAGVAALVFSAAPELPAWRVKRILEQTCKDLGEAGPDPEYGAGLLQALDAVRAAKKAAGAVK